MAQYPTEIIMVRPAAFGFDEETAQSNAFQSKPDQVGSVNCKAQAEFDGAVQQLRSHGVQVTVFQDTDKPCKPDAIFPNNWFSTHDNGNVFIYPMMAATRRMEIRPDIIDYLTKNKQVTEVIDLTHYVEKGKFLEGTGSIVFDHIRKKAYACRSVRTDAELLTEVCSKLNYEPVVFDSVDATGKPIYHTNVMMWIGTKVAAICADSIPDTKEREMVMNGLKSVGRSIVLLSKEDISAFAGNCLEVLGSNDKPYLAMSARAAKSLSNEKIDHITRNVPIIKINIETIENVGGGSVRCMLAGVHLK